MVKCPNCGKEIEGKGNFIYDTGECSHWDRIITEQEKEELEENQIDWEKIL